jgi:hypothetical protein
MKRPQQADTAIFNPFYFDIPQTSALSPQSYLFMMPDTYFLILTIRDTIQITITTSVSFAIKKPSSVMDQLWVVHLAIIGYRAVHEKKMAPVATRC